MLNSYLNPNINKVIANGVTDTAPMSLQTITGTMSYNLAEPNFIIIKNHNQTTIDIRNYDHLFYNGELAEVLNSIVVVPDAALLRVAVSGFSAGFTDVPIQITFGPNRPGYPRDWSLSGPGYTANGVGVAGGFNYRGANGLQKPIVITATSGDVLVTSGLIALSGDSAGSSPSGDPQKEGLSFEALKSEALGTVFVSIIRDEDTGGDVEIWKDSNWATISKPLDLVDANAINVAASGNSVVLTNTNGGEDNFLLGFIGANKLIVDNEDNIRHATVELVVAGGGGNLTFRLPANARNYEIELPDKVITQINFKSIGDIDNILSAGSVEDDLYPAIPPAVGDGHLIHIKAVAL